MFYHQDFEKDLKIFTGPNGQALPTLANPAYCNILLEGIRVFIPKIMIMSLSVQKIECNVLEHPV